MNTKTTSLILRALLLTLLAGVPPAARAQNPTNVISVNFQGRINSDPSNPATSPLNPTEVAGVVSTASWNNVDDAYDGDSSMAVFNGPEDGTTGPLKDGSGSLTPVTLTFQANDSWFNDVPALSISSPNARMMNGIIKSQDPGSVSVFTFNNLQDAQYDLYVYFNMNGDWVRTDITDGDFNKTFYVVEQHQFTDASSFVECTNTNPAGPYGTGNYVHFTNLATYGRSNLTVTATYISGADGNGISGLQLVKVGSAITNPPPPVIVFQPLSRIAELGTHVDFTVVAINAGFPLSYQWLLNGTPIAGATNKTFCLESVQKTDVASYQAKVIGTTTNISSDLAHLSVYTLICTNSNFGTLDVPITAFTSNQRYTIGAKTFTNAFSATNGVGGAGIFYGPSATPQSGPYQNTIHAPSLRVDTFSPNNGTTDTGIIIQNNFIPINPPVLSNDNATGGSNPNQSLCEFTLGTNSGSIKNSYRITILYNTPAPAGGKVTFNWLYH